MVTATLVSRIQSDADRELVDRHLHGDPTAFDEIYCTYGGMVYNLALRMLGNEADAADCAQEVFLRIFRHLGGFRARSALKTWVFRITMNCCRSRARRRAVRARHVEYGGEEFIARTEHRGRNPEQKAASQETSRVIHAALGSINPVYREAVILRDLQGLSYEEIAGVLGTRIGTVRSRIARGRDQLRRVMESDR